jgi:hypothetical protein
MSTIFFFITIVVKRTLNKKEKRARKSEKLITKGVLINDV